jgi:hypothetical protein
LAGITQEQLAERASLHVNSVRYMERQRWITTGHSSERVAEALANAGVMFFTPPHMRRAPQACSWRGVSRLIVVGCQSIQANNGAPLALTNKMGTARVPDHNRTAALQEAQRLPLAKRGIGHENAFAEHILHGHLLV